MARITRRMFCRKSLAAGAAAGLAATVPWCDAAGRVRGANDDVRIAIIGLGSTVKVGGQGKNDMRRLREVPGVRIAGLCDVDRAILEPEVENCQALGEDVESYTDVRRLLDSKDIDAVNITTPNHWHALATIWACQAGKDVHVQKPASHNIFEGRKMVEAAQRYDRIVQSSAGPRGRTGMGEAFAYIRQGHLGKILLSHGVNYRPRMSIGKVDAPTPVPETLDYDLWSGPAPIVPVMREFLHYDWHWNWLYGNGDLGNMGIHYMDGCRWALGQETLPERVISLGGRFGYSDDGETPNTQLVFLDYRPAPILFEVRALPKNAELRRQPWERNAAATMDEYRGIRIGTVVHCEEGYVVNNRAFDRQGELIQEFEPTNTDILTNFIEAVRSRRAGDLSTDVLEGHLSAALVHMGNISYRVGRAMPAGEIGEAVEDERDLLEAYDRMLAHLDANEIDLDGTPIVMGAWLRMDPAEERFHGRLGESANALLMGEYRPPFVVPSEV